MDRVRIFVLINLLALYTSCFVEGGRKLSEEPRLPVKSIMLYDTIGGFSLDTIIAALMDINQVISRIDERQTGYSLWRV